MATDHVAPRYLTRFQCIGAACEENCCKGWRVDVDKPHYLKLKVLMDDSSADRARFRAVHQRNDEPTTNDNTYAQIKLNSDGSCPVLEKSGLCSTHSRFGADALSNACAIYPRSANIAAERIEVTASISCPEIARQALLHEDALDLVRIPAESYERQHFVQQITSSDAYQTHVDDVRAFVTRLLSLRQFPMSTRLFFVTRFAHRAAAFLPGAATGPALESLVQAMAELDNPDALQAWHAHVTPIAPPLTLAARLIMQILKARLEDTPANSFRQLVVDVLGEYADPGATEINIDPATLWEAYRARRDALSPHAARIDLIVENYAKNYWLRDWYTRSPDLAAHQRRLLVRVAVLRFLLHSHPRLKNAAETNIELIDKVAIEVFYKFSRGVEHAAPFLARIGEILDADGPRHLAHDVFLIKL